MAKHPAPSGPRSESHLHMGSFTGVQLHIVMFRLSQRPPGSPKRFHLRHLWNSTSTTLVPFDKPSVVLDSQKTAMKLPLSSHWYLQAMSILALSALLFHGKSLDGIWKHAENYKQRSYTFYCKEISQTITYKKFWCLLLLHHYTPQQVQHQKINTFDFIQVCLTKEW